MVSNKSLDEHMLIAALLHDVHKSHGVVFNTRSLRLTLNKVSNRLRYEGIGFLTKTLPRLGKALHRALSCDTPLNAVKLGFEPQPYSELPRFLGEFFNRVLHPDGTVLQNPCIDSIKVLQDLLFVFYKYELPYTDEQEQQVVSRFERTEDDLLARSFYLRALHYDTDHRNPFGRRCHTATSPQVRITREARRLLKRVFQNFDFRDITPRHGPGAVATRQRLSSKFLWTNVSSRITDMYPLDEYFYASLGHVCDSYRQFDTVTSEDLPARVVLVQKDSRGPRLISCEPVDFQWIQQGIMRELVRHVEQHHLTKWNVFFTDQAPNQRGALIGSLCDPKSPSTARYSTIDLNEASDRVSLDLIRLIFPDEVIPYLEAVRSSSTELPSGKKLQLRKFAPMGSALCFPVMALTIWALLTAAAPDADTRERILVYGDDVIVPTAYAANAMEQLEVFGLKVNRDKSCTSGFFRESCGVEAFNGHDITPVRLRTVWSSSRCPESYTSWIAYANSFYDRKYYSCYDSIVEALFRIYGPIPDESMHLACPSLREVPEFMKPRRRRYNKALQKLQYLVYDVKAPTVTEELPGWSMLLRFFTESGAASNEADPFINKDPVETIDFSRTGVLKPLQRTVSRYQGDVKSPFSVRLYTKRRQSMLCRRWR